MSGLDLKLNLSTRPFKPYRAANMGLFVLLLLLISVSVWQAFNYRHYAALSAGISEKESQVRTEVQGFSAQLTKLNADMNRSDIKEQLVEIEFLNQLILRKRFSWTRVFAILEDLLPEGVYLMSLRPTIGEDGAVTLGIIVRGRTTTDAIQFVHVLEESKFFDNVTVPQQIDAKATREVSTGEIELELSANYFPERASE
jgi:Tfp pilus assembly protein PilN